MTQDIYNERFALAADLVNCTSHSIFLTGKAGTGKTTFLKHIRKTSAKNMAVLAPTGVAAINAGGVTMHSFFLLPFEPFLPLSSGWDGSYVHQSSAFSKIRLNKAKRDMMQRLELIIIDEISMVRCDTLDATDAILRMVRKNNSPFGGVQMLFIGDMFQLPPVIKEDEWALLKEYYESPYFFHSKVIQQNPPLHIELTKIYRQKEQQYIELLNNIRNNTMSAFDFELLQSRYQPDFKTRTGEFYITISSHNYKADAINATALQQLPGKTFVYKGKIEGDFYENNLPTERELTLKENAQVMFIKNDTGDYRRYYNGKLARIHKLSKESIVVITNEDNEEIELEIEEWKNIRYRFNKETNKLEEEVVGIFRQYPIRLAWAITIHKSQGLTFNKVIVDAGQSFAPGQVYVALSRCTTLEGMVLLSPVRGNVIHADERILDFASHADTMQHLYAILNREKHVYLQEQLLKTFDYREIVDALTEFVNTLPEKSIPGKDAAYAMALKILNAAETQAQVASRFSEKLPALIAAYLEFQSADFELKMRSGVHWFARSITEELVQPLFRHWNALAQTARTKTHRKEVAELLQLLQGKVHTILTARYGELTFADADAHLQYKPTGNETTGVKSAKPAKGDSKKESLRYYNDGLSPVEISKMRKLAVSTIEGHLSDFVLTGEVDIFRMLTESQVEELLQILEESGDIALTDLRRNAGNAFSYGQIKAVINYRQRLKTN